MRTRVGYAGGAKKNPTYYSLGDHTETIQIDFDPTKLSYRELLDIFWQSHAPTERSWSKQYKAAIFFHNEEQKKAAIETKNIMEKKLKSAVYTELIPFSEFYPAEEYHHKHSLRQFHDIYNELRALYPGAEDFINSTAVARINGYLGGYGTAEELKEELESLGLSPSGSKRLLDIVSSSRRIPKTCPL